MSIRSKEQDKFIEQTKLEKQGLLYRDINWIDKSSNTRCEIQV